MEVAAAPNGIILTSPRISVRQISNNRSMTIIQLSHTRSLPKIDKDNRRDVQNPTTLEGQNKNGASPKFMALTSAHTHSTTPTHHLLSKPTPQNNVATPALPINPPTTPRAMATPPTLTFHPLPNQGSCTLTQHAHTILASVTGPIEATRRDLDPYGAALEINVRPAAGPSGPRDRHVEAILLSALRRLVDLQSHPRCVVQITLQVMWRAEGLVEEGAGMVMMVPALLNAAVGALLDGGVEMRGVAVGVCMGSLEGEQGVGKGEDVEMGDEGGSGSPRVMVLNDEKQVEDVVRTGAGIHAFAFTGKSELLLAESEGLFSFEAWEGTAQEAKRVCCSGKGAEESLVEWLHGQVGAELSNRRRWSQER